jgi:S-adenosylmethionine:tRNA ribosyltransferase-isomerase
LRLSDFDFELPEASIAQAPLEDRAGARMLVVDRKAGTWTDRHFRDLPEYLGAGDCLVLNDSRVIPARLYGHRAAHTGRVEVLLVEPRGGYRTWLALVKPGRKLPVGERIEFARDFRAEVIERTDRGERVLRFEGAEGEDAFWARLEGLGHVPLPPYIHREDAAADRERYQTVFARERGSVAAPTAGLHFTPEVMAACQARDAEVARVTLHVGLGTFQPIEAEELSEVKLHSERFSISSGAQAAIRQAARVIACGTTSLRAIESLARGMQGETEIFLSPGDEFFVTKGLLTNFHLPKSSLFVLVCALGGTELMKSAYRHAIKAGYRFYSYGDCMLIL